VIEDFRTILDVVLSKNRYLQVQLAHFVTGRLCCISTSFFVQGRLPVYRSNVHVAAGLLLPALCTQLEGACQENSINEVLKPYPLVAVLCESLLPTLRSAAVVVFLRGSSLGGVFRRSRGCSS